MAAAAEDYEAGGQPREEVRASRQAGWLAGWLVCGYGVLKKPAVYVTCLVPTRCNAQVVAALTGWPTSSTPP